MSPVNNVMHYNKNGEWKTYITGLDHVDMLEAVHEVGYNLSNNKLDTAAKEIIGEDYGKTEAGGWKYWKTDYKKFLEYSIRDVEILKRIDDDLGIFSLYCTIQKMTNITNLNDVSFKSSVVDKFILSECHGNMVFPTRRTAEKQKYMGATVLDPKAGLYENVGVVDYASLYPTSIMSFNLSPETFICSDKMCNDRGIDINDVVAKLDERGLKYVDTGFSDELFGGRYLFYAQEERVGLLPRILKKMYAERRRIKAEMKNTDDPILLNALDHHQLTLKIVLNSAYGAFGFNYFRLYKPEVADAITFFARRALDFAIEGLVSYGQTTIYGDTDSVFFEQSSGWKDHHKKWEKWFAIQLNDVFIPQYNNGCVPEYQMMELEYEKDLERIYFGDSKKRYYGIERNTGKKYIKGLNIIRKDAPPFLKVKLNEITEMVVRNKLTLNHILDLRKEIESIPYEQLAITKKFSKRFELYQKTQPQHVKGARFANEILGTSIDHRDMPYLFYIVSHCEGDKKKADRNKAICLLDEHLHFIDERKDLFELDYDTYFQKQVVDQLMEFEHIPYLSKIIKEYKTR
jgi:DNA polymerase elongation subunit (family B)